RVLASDSATLTWSAKVSRVCSWASVNGCPPPEDPPPENPPPEDPPEDPPPEDPLREEPVWNETTTRLPTTVPFSRTGAAIAARAPRSTSSGIAYGEAG